jgi:hypothetical protein
MVEWDEGFFFIDTAVNLVRQEFARVVARQIIDRLRQVVGAEAEEVGAHRDLVRDQGSPRQLDHSADLVFNRLPVSCKNLGGHFVNQRPRNLHSRGALTSKIMISGIGAAPLSFATAIAASKIAFAWIL